MKPRDLFVLLLCVVIGMTAAAQEARLPDHDPYDRILRRFVRDGGVDYERLQRTLPPRRLLHEYLLHLNTFDPDALPAEEQLPFYLNLYNATVIEAITDRYEPGYSVAAEDHALFKEPIVKLAGDQISLNDLEKRIVEKFNDPRVHAALVCGAESCPKLQPFAYKAAYTQDRLETNMREFINDPQRNTIDPARKRLVLSKIFDWYPEDFGGRDNLAAYVDQYVHGDTSGFDVSFHEYSWKLNGSPPAEPATMPAEE